MHMYDVDLNIYIEIAEAKCYTYIRQLYLIGFRLKKEKIHIIV